MARGPRRGPLFRIAAEQTFPHGARRISLISITLSTKCEGKVALCYKNGPFVSSG